MHRRLAALVFALLCAACSKTDSPSTAGQPATPPPDAKSAPAPAPKIAAAPSTEAKAPPLPPPAPSAMRGAASTKPIPAPVEPRRIPVAQPEHAPMLGSDRAVTDQTGVERIALTPGSHVAPAQIAQPNAPTPQAAYAQTEYLEVIKAPNVAQPPSSAPSDGATTAYSATLNSQVLAAPSIGAPTISSRHVAPPVEAPATESAPTLDSIPTSAVAARKANQPQPILSVVDGTRPITSLNELIVDSIQLVPPGGSYRADQAAMDLLRNAITISDKHLVVVPDLVRPSFCSEATYVVFLLAVERLQKSNRLQLSDAAMNALLVHGQRDGEGIWGRWNANGPGTARLFHELGLGLSFSNPAAARPGDFMKIWWNDEIGAKERGHSVIFLGLAQTDKGEIGVHYWSSNKASGYSEATVPMSSVKRMLFSRLDNPRALVNAASLPKSDQYLADMLKRASTAVEMAKLCGVQ